MSLFAALMIALAVQEVKADNDNVMPPIESDYTIAVLMGQPCRGYQLLAGATAYNPKKDRELFFMTSSNEPKPFSLIAICHADNAVTSVNAPSGEGAWALSVLPDGNRLAVGTSNNGRVLMFDLEQWKFTAGSTMPGTQTIWNFTPGRGGKMYFGTFPVSKLGAFTLPSILEVVPEINIKDLGSAMPQNAYLRQVLFLLDGSILCTYGMEQPGARIFYPDKGVYSELPASMDGVLSGVTWNNYFLSGNKVFNTALEAVTPPPFPLPPSEKGSWMVDETITSEKTLFLRQGSALWRLDSGKTELAKVFDFDLKGGRILAASKTGGVYGVRGNYYFKIEPGSESLVRAPFGDSMPIRPILFLASDNKDHIYGGPPYGQTLFSMERDTGTATNTDVVVNSPGEVFDMLFVGTVGFGVSYSNGDIFRYETDKPFKQFEGENPKILDSLGPKGYDRPIGGIVVGPGNNLFSGWMAMPGVYGGAVAVTEPETGKTTLLENPLGKQTVSGLAVSPTTLYVGTSLEAAALPKKSGEAPQFGLISLETRQISKKIPFEGATTVDRLAYNPLAQRVVFAVDGVPRVFDIDGMTVSPAFDPAPPKVTSNKIVLAGDEYVYYGSGKQIVRLDPILGSHTVISELLANINAITVETQGNMFVSCGPDVYRIIPKQAK